MCVCENYLIRSFTLITASLYTSPLRPLVSTQNCQHRFILMLCLLKIFYVGWLWILGIHLYDDDDNDTIHVQVVIERPSLRPGQGAATKETDEDVVLLYIAQLAALAVLLTAMWVLVTSRYFLFSSVLCPQITRPHQHQARPGQAQARGHTAAQFDIRSVTDKRRRWGYISPVQAATWSATASAAAAATRGTGAGARHTTRTSRSTGRPAGPGVIVGQ